MDFFINILCSCSLCHTNIWSCLSLDYVPVHYDTLTYGFAYHQIMFLFLLCHTNICICYHQIMFLFLLCYTNICICYHQMMFLFLLCHTNICICHHQIMSLFLICHTNICICYHQIMFLFYYVTLTYVFVIIRLCSCSLYHTNIWIC